jgi:hypothetical protein
MDRCARPISVGKVLAAISTQTHFRILSHITMLTSVPAPKVSAPRFPLVFTKVAVPTLFQIDVACAELPFRGDFFVHVIVCRAAGSWKANGCKRYQQPGESEL